MASYSKGYLEKTAVNGPGFFTGKNRKLCMFFSAVMLMFMIISTPCYSNQDKKIAVVPFKIVSTTQVDHLKTGLQGMLTDKMAEMGFETVRPELINSKLGEIFSYSDISKNIVPAGKSLGADWIVVGLLNYEDDNLQIEVKVVDVKNSVTPFSIMMIENNINNLPETINKIAVSLNSQMRETVLIEDILVEGNKRASDEAVLNIIESQKGDKYDEEKLNRDLHSVYKMGIFDYFDYKVVDGRTGKIITFNVVEKPYISKIIFKGNEEKKESNLLEELGIKQYDVLDHNEIKQSIKRLLEKYKEDGYYHVEITDKIEQDEDNSVSLTYNIKEGEKVYISDIRFIGNKAFKDKELKKVLLTKEKGWMSWFTDSGILDRKKLEFDIFNLNNFYRNNGYLHARAGDPEIILNEKGLSIDISITEGDKYSIDTLAFEGDLIKTENELMEYLTVKKGNPFNKEAIQNDIEVLKNIYGQEGYAYVEIAPLVKEKEESLLVDISFKIIKNKKVRFERINIIGNDTTRDKVIRRELDFAEGEDFSGLKLAKSSARLNRLYYIENNEIKTGPGTKDDLMQVDVEIEERPAGKVEFALGYGGFDKFATMFSYGSGNFRGLGQTFEIDATFSSRSTRFNLSFTEPWLFDRKIRGSANIFRWDLDYDDYTRERLGGEISISSLMGWDEYTWGSLKYTYDDSTVTDINERSSVIIQDMAGAYLTSSVTFGINRNSQDRPWNTSRGSVNSFNLEYAGGFLGGDVSFNKYTLNSIWYLPMIWKTVLVTNLQFGYVQGRSDGRLPLYEKFRIGGIDTVRGFEWGTISPLDPETYDELGGDKNWVYKLEYRFPLVKGEGIRGLVFFDSGNAFTKGTSWVSGAGTSVGFGVRWISPMGPIRLEYGIKLNKIPNDDSNGRFEFKMAGTY